MDEVVEALELQRYLGATAPRPFALFGTSVVDGTGYPEVFQWLSSLV
jgi:hypothetical protein